MSTSAQSAQELPADARALIVRQLGAALANAWIRSQQATSDQLPTPDPRAETAA